MNQRFLFVLIFFSLVCSAQVEEDLKLERKFDKQTTEKKASVDLYKIISLDNDTTYVDTTLTIQREYKFNYLRKDTFGLLQFLNEGQTYNTLNFGLTQFNPYPEFGFKAKHFNYLEVQDINYYNVPTPYSDLYFKSVMEQGQNLDAFVSLNTSRNLNFSVGYKGLRSLGKYRNQLRDEAVVVLFEFGDHAICVRNRCVRIVNEIATLADDRVRLGQQLRKPRDQGGIIGLKAG